MPNFADFRLSETVTIAADAATLYNMITDIGRMGEWSPECTGAVWDEGAGPTVGSEFTGHNQYKEHVWERRCRVIVANPNAEFAWLMSDTARWGYVFVPVDGGTEVTESWAIEPGEDPSRLSAVTDEQWQGNFNRAKNGLTVTLARLKEAAEAGA
jgi:Polyketide cyclase / dehydrase and lipid transport